MSHRDPRMVSAVRLVISDIQRSVSSAIAEARFFELWEAMRAEDAESPSERCRRENAEGLRLITSLGNSPMKAAQRICPDSPNDHYRLSQRFRRLLREKK